MLSDGEIRELSNSVCAGDAACAVQRNNGFNTLITPDPVTADPVDAPGAPAVPARTVTIADVERFLPVQSVLHMEPDGWAVVGVPANFWTEVEPVVVDGELLGEAVQVRFTPLQYRWEYGDGTTRTTRTAGSSWADAGLDELAATRTSHLYREKATVDARVTVVWTAEYRIADGAWIPVAGAVARAGPTEPVLVVKERTVLTAG